MKDNPALLDLMLRDEATAGDIYRPGPYWRPYQRRIVQAIRKHGIERFRSVAPIAKGFAVSHVFDPFDEPVTPKTRLAAIALKLPLLRDVAGAYRTLLAKEHRVALEYQEALYRHRFGSLVEETTRQAPLPDTCHGGCVDAISIAGTTQSAEAVLHLARIDSFDAAGADFATARAYMEIGGGFGLTTHLLLTRYPNLRKVVYLDIPPMIYIATQYLRHFFPTAVRDYSQSANLGEISFSGNDDLEILCLCPWQVERLGMKDVDFLYNFASFSEMTPAIVRNYATHVEPALSAGARLVLGLNKLEADRRDDVQVCVPDRVAEAFAPKFSFLAFDAKWDLPGDRLHWLGRRAGR